MVGIKLPESTVDDVEVLIAEETLLVVDVIKRIEGVDYLRELRFTQSWDRELFVPCGGDIKQAGNNSRYVPDNKIR